MVHSLTTFLHGVIQAAVALHGDQDLGVQGLVHFLDSFLVQGVSLAVLQAEVHGTTHRGDSHQTGILAVVTPVAAPVAITPHYWR